MKRFEIFHRQWSIEDEWILEKDLSIDQNEPKRFPLDEWWCVVPIDFVEFEHFYVVPNDRDNVVLIHECVNFLSLFFKKYAKTRKTFGQNFFFISDREWPTWHDLLDDNVESDVSKFLLNFHLMLNNVNDQDPLESPLEDQQWTMKKIFFKFLHWNVWNHRAKASAVDDERFSVNIAFSFSFFSQQLISITDEDRRMDFLSSLFFVRFHFKSKITSSFDPSGRHLFIIDLNLNIFFFKFQKSDMGVMQRYHRKRKRKKKNAEIRKSAKMSLNEKETIFFYLFNVLCAARLFLILRI